MDTLDIQVDAKRADALLRGLSQPAMQAAWRRTLRKSANWLKARTARELNKTTKMAQSVIRARLRYYQHTMDEGKLWAGLNPVEAHLVGKVSRAAGGVAVAGHTFPKAWRMTKKRPNGPIYYRAGKARFPIIKATVDWDEAAHAAILAELPKLEAQILVILEKEIDGELAKAGIR